MNTCKHIRCTLAAPDAEVVTRRDSFSGTFVTTIQGGPLDGEEYPSVTFLGSLLRHKNAVEMARIAAREIAD